MSNQIFCFFNGKAGEIYICLAVIIQEKKMITVASAIDEIPVCAQTTIQTRARALTKTKKYKDYTVEWVNHPHDHPILHPFITGGEN